MRVGLPVAGRLISPGWHEVGAFLGDSIRDFHRLWPPDRLIGALAGRRYRRGAVAPAVARRGSRDVGCPARETGLLRARTGWLEGLRDAVASPVHGLASRLRRDRRLSRGGCRLGSPVADSGRLRARDGCRRTRARRAHTVGRCGRRSPSRGSSASRRLGHARLCDRDRRRDRVRPGDPRVRRGGRRARARLQPRVVRWPGAHRTSASRSRGVRSRC